ncbi:flagellar protein FliL [Brucella inopinata]|nr:flagellar protein FliL [Brucella inopinata]
MSDAAREKDGKAKGSMMGLLAVVAVLTAIAGGGGWYMGNMISAGQQASAKPSGKEDKPKPGSFESLHRCGCAVAADHHQSGHSADHLGAARSLACRQTRP